MTVNIGDCKTCFWKKVSFDTKGSCFRTLQLMVGVPSYKYNTREEILIDCYQSEREIEIERIEKKDW